MGLITSLSTIDFASVCFLLLTAVLLIVGLIGVFVPMLPGPPIAYLGMLVLQFSSLADFSVNTLIGLGVAVVVITLIDYFFPMLATKQSGGGKWSVWGCLIGMLCGMFLPLFNSIVGALLGAIVGQFIESRKLGESLLVGFKAFLSVMFGIILKLIVCLWVVYDCVVAVLALT
ncbi:MAG: DUF456 domain-containing protein [Bacteroidales bacterium]|nr:DUF456 domain-containing protein [Bacteroidales bacterium]